MSKIMPLDHFIEAGENALYWSGEASIRLTAGRGGYWKVEAKFRTYQYSNAVDLPFLRSLLALWGIPNEGWVKPL